MCIGYYPISPFMYSYKKLIKYLFILGLGSLLAYSIDWNSVAKQKELKQHSFRLAGGIPGDCSPRKWHHHDITDKIMVYSRRKYTQYIASLSGSL